MTTITINTEEFPPISAIVPVYNKAPYLVESIASLKAQEYPNLEILICDDGSTDESCAVITSLGTLFPTLDLKAFSKPNGGASEARNVLIREARYDIISSMDADDIMQPGFLREAAKLIAAEGADVVYSDLELFGNETSEWCPPPFDAYHIRYNNCVPSLSLYRKELWTRVGGYDESYPFNEDWNFFVALSRSTSKFVKIPRKLFRYRQTGTGLFHNYVKETWEWSVSMIVCGNDDLYPVDEVLWAVDRLKEMPDRWIERFIAQDTRHPRRYLLKLWRAIKAEARGQVQEAIDLYAQAVETSGGMKWLPLYQLGLLLAEYNQSASVQTLSMVRILRPDMNKHVNPKLQGFIGRKAV